MADKAGTSLMAGTGSRLVEPWAGFQGQTEPGRSLAPPQPQHTCGQLPVSIGAPAPGISSCLHHNHPSWAPDSTSQNPSEALILFTLPACAHTPHILVYASQRCVDTGQKNPQTSSYHVNHHTCTYIHSLADRYLTIEIVTLHLYTQGGHTKTSTSTGI